MNAEAVNGNQVQIADSSSERDSGTGDSRKSRDNLDQSSDILITNPQLSEFVEEFDDSELPQVNQEDSFDEETGCGEAMLSASNSQLASSESGDETFYSEVDKSRTLNPDQNSSALELQDLSFKTFHPHRSLSRDFLNETETNSSRTDSKFCKKRASAIELNGEKYLVIDRKKDQESDLPLLDQMSYRGGIQPGKTRYINL